MDSVPVWIRGEIDSYNSNSNLALSMFDWRGVANLIPATEIDDAYRKNIVAFAKAFLTLCENFIRERIRPIQDAEGLFNDVELTWYMTDDDIVATGLQSISVTKRRNDDSEMWFHLQNHRIAQLVKQDNIYDFRDVFVRMRTRSTWKFLNDYFVVSIVKVCFNNFD